MIAAAALLAAAPAAARTWRDPVAYCRAVRTVDRPDRRYTGPPTMDWMRRPWADGPATLPDGRPTPVSWRCLAGRVETCVGGGEVACDEKADTSRRPRPDAARFCREHPGESSIPLAATGHATVYDWTCRGARAVARPPAAGVDARGFPEALWKPAAP